MVTEVTKIRILDNTWVGRRKNVTSIKIIRGNIMIQTQLKATAAILNIWLPQNPSGFLNQSAT